MISIHKLLALIEGELASITDSDVAAAIQPLLVTPYCVLRDWDYADSTQYPCWIVIKDPKHGQAIAYCEFGFGPSNPWGILGMDTGFNDMGPDYCWYNRMEDAFRESWMWEGNNPPGYEVQ